MVPTTLKEKIYFLAKVVASSILKRDNRYMSYSLLPTKKQIIFDKDKSEKFNIHVRNKIDLILMNEIFIREGYSLPVSRRNEIAKFYESIKKPLIIDCGCNNGISTNYFKRKYSKAKIIGIEPEQKNIELAKKNNPNEDVDFILAGVASEELNLAIEENSETWAYRTKQNKNGKIPGIKINTLLRKYSNYKPFIIKIDIEGYEKNLFEKNTGWANKFPVIIIEPHDWMIEKKSIIKNFLCVISKYNRDFIIKGENIFSISNNLH